MPNLKKIIEDLNKGIYNNEENVYKRTDVQRENDRGKETAHRIRKINS